MSHRIWLSILTQSPPGGLLWFPSCGRRGPPKAKHCLDAPGKKKWRGLGWFLLTTWWFGWFKEWTNPSWLYSIVVGLNHMSVLYFFWYLLAHPTNRKWVITPVINGISSGNVHWKDWGELPHLRSVGWTTKYKHYRNHDLPSGKLSHNYGKSPLLMGKLTINGNLFNSYVKLPEGKPQEWCCYLDFFKKIQFNGFITYGCSWQVMHYEWKLVMINRNGIKPLVHTIVFSGWMVN